MSLHIKEKLSSKHLQYRCVFCGCFWVNCPAIFCLIHSVVNFGDKIDQYLKHKGVYKLGGRIEFSKGDSHQLLFDMASSDDFEYMNYPALSPSSDWVQVNFKKGRRGFVLQHFDGETEDKIINPIFLTKSI